ncbi:hypothetical protein G6045_40285 [Streptomyces sp. YC504]|uniref:Uncharacterized protein n=1 Tax=Streptomyces mesophilus TaxID=1775132 RepID=A0A6G4XZ22_9ACTN|nr:hypothetical protein [Streptomyces mesophilus]NGO81841.1 hypothetical protein [Streptomyces mesophilus]
MTLTRIIDVAHTGATWHRLAPSPALDAARRAITFGHDIDDSAEVAGYAAKPMAVQYS